MLEIISVQLYLFPMEQNTITPEMETVLDMMKELSREGQEKVVESLYELVSELRSEARWRKLLEEQSGPMEEMAEEALREHRENKTTPM